MPRNIQLIKYTKVELDTTRLLTEATRAKQSILALACSNTALPADKKVTLADLLAPPAPPAIPTVYPEQMVTAAKKIKSINDDLEAKCQRALAKYDAALAGHQAFSEDLWEQEFAANARIEAAKLAMAECQQTIARAQDEANNRIEQLFSNPLAEDVAALGIDPAVAQTDYSQATDNAKAATEENFIKAQNTIRKKLNEALIETEKLDAIKHINNLDKERADRTGLLGSGSEKEQELANKDTVTTSSGKLAQVNQKFDKGGSSIEVTLVGKDSLNLIITTLVFHASTKDIRDLLHRVKAESGLESVTISARIQHVDIHGSITGYEDSTKTLRKMYIEAHKMGFRNVNISPQCHWKPDAETLNEVKQIKQERLFKAQKTGQVLQEASSLTVHDKDLNYYKTLIETDCTMDIPPDAKNIPAAVNLITAHVTDMFAKVQIQIEEIKKQLEILQKDKEAEIDIRTRANELNKMIDNVQNCISAANDLAAKSRLKDHLNGKAEFKDAIDQLNNVKKPLVDQARLACNELLVAKDADNKADNKAGIAIVAIGLKR